MYIALHFSGRSLLTDDDDDDDNDDDWSEEERREEFKERRGERRTDIFSIKGTINIKIGVIASLKWMYSRRFYLLAIHITSNS